MNNRILACLRQLISVFILYLAAIISAKLAFGEPVNLRVALPLSSSTFIGQNLTAFKEEVERRTDKRVTIEIFENGKLVKDPEMLEAVASGRIEMADVTAPQFVGKVPAVELFSQPFLLNFNPLIKTTMNPDREIRKLLDGAILAATGARVLWWQPYGTTIFFSKGRAVPDPEDIKGAKVRVADATLGEIVRSCGGEPMIIPPAGMAEAMASGAVTMITNTVAAVKARELWKVADTITKTNHAVSPFLVIINEKVWQSLPDGDRAILSEVARKVEGDLQENFPAIEAADFEFAAAKGMKILDLAPDQVVRWRVCSSPVLEQFDERAGELGGEIMKAYGRLRQDPCCSRGPAGAFALH